VSGEIRIRRELRPGDAEAIVRMHGVLYRREYDLSPNMEHHVAAAVDAAVDRGWPKSGGGIWVVEHDGEFAGSVAFTDEGDRRAALRWFLFDPAVRGRGIGKQLVGELVDEAEGQGYEMIWLETLAILTTAAKIYSHYGFTVVHEQMGPPWGDPYVPYRRYELALPRDGADRAAPRALAGSA
jgi:GNAT superfamily N-acetyltransferase